MVTKGEREEGKKGKIRSVGLTDKNHYIEIDRQPDFIV